MHFESQNYALFSIFDQFCITQTILSELGGSAMQLAHTEASFTHMVWTLE